MRADISFKRSMRRAGGIYGEDGRILNADTGSFIIGIIDVNEMATSPRARTLIYKAYYEAGTDIQIGSRLVDRSDDTKYFVMHQKTELHRGRPAYVDATVYFCNKTIEIKRLSDAVNAFGRSTDVDFNTVAQDVWAQVVPLVTDVIEQEDRLHSKGKLEVIVQSGTDVSEGDRIVTNDGRNYKVNAIDYDTLTNLLKLTVEVDDR